GGFADTQTFPNWSLGMRGTQSSFSERLGGYTNIPKPEFGNEGKLIPQSSRSGRFGGYQKIWFK
ncbi:MAG TPA: hypothetical protein PK605_09595, partial [Ignavibacteria bacterium]|nr:hypothetical protein [Ignavibacteria bacterium]